MKPENVFFKLLGLTLVLCVIQDGLDGVWFIHNGAFYPWIHPQGIWLYPPAFLMVEWLGVLSSGLMIFSGWKRSLGIIIGTLSILIGVLERFSNHRALLLIVLFYLLLGLAKTVDSKKYSFQLIRYQLLIVYLFSAVNKLNLDFWTGQSLGNLALVLEQGKSSFLPQPVINFLLTGSMGKFLSVGTLVLEFAIPFLLIKIPRLGLPLMIALHVSFSLIMPGIWPFTLLMITMGVLFYE